VRRAWRVMCATTCRRSIHDPATRAYLKRRIGEGKTRREAMRNLNATSPAASEASWVSRRPRCKAIRVKNRNTSATHGMLSAASAPASVSGVSSTPRRE
jgi:hypothetical protein